jgi:ceramide glucosyltransferase
VQKGWLVAHGDWVLMTDCNMLLPVDAIQRLEARWTPTTGMVCSPPIGSRPDNFWAEVECAYLNQFEAKWQLMADRLGYGFAQGKVMFCCKSQFDALGGLLTLDMEPCEDAAATKLVRQAGLHVHLVRKLFEQPLGHRSLQRVWHRQLRWAKLRRVTFPVQYGLELLVTPIPFLIALFGTSPTWPLMVFLMFYGMEIGLAKWQGWHVSWWTPLAMVVRDVIVGGVWLVGWFGDDINWAGQKLALHPTMIADAPDDGVETMISG